MSRAIERLKKNKQKEISPAIFVKNADVSDTSLDINYIIPSNVLFDIVSCQMSMHYIFNSEESVRCFLNIVTARLVPGGFFIGTIPDSNVLVKKVRASKEIIDKEGKKRMFTFGNGFYRSAEHTSELQSHSENSYAVLCLKSTQHSECSDNSQP